MANELVRLVRPLLEMYRLWGTPPPALNRVERQEVPEPYRKLLVNDEHLRMSLHSYHRVPTTHQVIKRHVTGPALLRHVSIGLNDPLMPEDNRAVAAAVTKLDLSLMPHTLHGKLLNGTESLTEVLALAGISYITVPKAFLRFRSERLLNEIFGLTDAEILYGRCGYLYDHSWHVIADVVEVLPPLLDIPDPTE